MHEELIHDLRLNHDTVVETYSQDGMEITETIYSQAADAIEEDDMAFRQLERYYKELCDHLPKWIPATERLPEKEKRTYWICTDTGYQCECRWTNNRFGIGESDEWGWNIADVPQYHKVTAWMFLPESYEPPKEE